MCIAELMAFKMSKGNVAHGEEEGGLKKKAKLLALCGFSSKIGSCALCTLTAAIHSARDLSLSLSLSLSAPPRKVVNSIRQRGNLSVCILNLLIFTTPHELKSLAFKICSLNLYDYVFASLLLFFSLLLLKLLPIKL